MTEALTLEQVTKVLEIQGDHLVWRISRAGIKAGTTAGKTNDEGYIEVTCLGRFLKAHRVVWLLTYGEWPEEPLDHIDGNRTNNLPSNLRLCNHSTNQMNAKARGKTKFKGVVELPHGRFQAQCAKKYLGSFDSPELAARAYDAEASVRYGEFARLNFGASA